MEKSDHARYSVAVVKSNSDLSNFGQLRGKRSCHSGFGQLSSWTVPIGALIRDKVVEASSCNRAQVVVDYFHGSCVPGAADARINPNGTGVEQLCSQCIGDERGQHVCDLNFGERYSGEDGAMRCLIEGRGDVAFVTHDTVLRLTNGRYPVSWAADLKASDFRLLCRLPTDGSQQYEDTFPNLDDTSTRSSRSSASRTLFQALITDFRRCNIARIPDPIVATSMFTPVDVRLDSLLLLTQLSDHFLGPQRNSFRLAGIFRNRSDLIFSDHIQEIKALKADTSFQEALGQFLPFLSENDPVACRSSPLIISPLLFLPLLLLIHLIQ